MVLLFQAGVMAHRVVVDSIDWAAINSESQSKRTARLARFADDTNHEVERLMAADTVIDRAELPADFPQTIADRPYKLFLPLSPNGTGRTLPNDIRIDLQVESAGIQRLDHADLLAAGIDLSGVNAAELRPDQSGRARSNPRRGT